MKLAEIRPYHTAPSTWTCTHIIHRHLTIASVRFTKSITLCGLIDTGWEVREMTAQISKCDYILISFVSVGEGK